MHLLRLPTRETVVKREQNRESAVMACAEVVHREALHERLLVATPAQLAAGDCLAELLAAAAAGPEAGLAEGADRRVDNVGLDAADVVLTAAEALGHAPGEVLVEHIRAGCQTGENFFAFGGLEVHQHRALAAVGVQMQAELVVERAVDFDDVHAVFGEDPRGGGASQNLAHVDRSKSA